MQGNLIVSNNSSIREVNLTVNGTTTINGSDLHFDTSPTGTKVFKGLVTVNGSWLNDINDDIEFQGGLQNNGTFTSGTGTYSLTTNSQDIQGSNPITFSKLTINTPGTISLLTNNVTVTTLLTMTSGKINTGSYKLILSNNATGAVIYNSGVVIGKLQRAINTSGTYLFPVGTALNYRPATLDFVTAVAGDLIGEFIPSDPGTISSSYVDGAVTVNSLFSDGYWYFERVGFGSNNYNLSLDGNGFTDYTIDANTRISSRIGAGNWINNGTHGSFAGSVITRTGMDNLNSTPVSYAFGISCPTEDLVVSDPTICLGNSATITVSSSQNDVSYQLRLDTDDSNVGAPVTGDGGDISFTVNPGVNTTYNILATSSGCSVELTDKSIVTVNATSIGGSVSGSASICNGGSTGALTLSGYTGSITKWQKRVDGGVWTDISNTLATYSETPSSVGVWDYRAEVKSGTCSVAYSSIATITVVDDPVANDLTKSPADATVCAGTTLTATVSGASGGTGTITDEYRYTTDNGASWSGWSTTIPSFAAVTGTNRIESRRTATGTDCNTSPVKSISWIVVDDPVANDLTKSPADATVCAGTTLTATVSGASGGTGTITDEYRYTTDNGASWSGWSTTIPSFAAVTGTSRIESRRTATGTDCNTSPVKSISWIVVDDPVANDLTKSPADATVCAGTTLTATVSGASGGTGTITDEYRYTTDNGTSWSGWSTTIPSFAAVTGTSTDRKPPDGHGDRLQYIAHKKYKLDRGRRPGRQ